MYRQTNINSYIKVKLKAEGHEILRREREELRKSFPKLEPYAPKVDEAGYTSFQMWDFMRRFGKHISLGCVPPFETVVEIETES